MRWLTDLLTNEHSIATCLLVLALTIVTGLALGQVRFRGIRLGVAGVLFSGLLLGHFGLAVEHHALEFAREFGLVLFVYAVGLAVGPGFFNAFRLYGLKTNLYALAIVLLGTLTAVGASWLGGVSPAIAVGILSGATTNTPSLAAASQTLADNPLSVDSAKRALQQAGIAAEGMTTAQLAEETNKLPGLGYAVTYPFGVIGIILAMLILGHLFRVDPVADAKSLEKGLEEKQSPQERMAIRLTRAERAGSMASALPGEVGSQAVINVVWRGGKALVALTDIPLAVGDVLYAVGTEADLERLRDAVGDKADLRLFARVPDITARRVLVSRGELVGRPLESLHLAERFHVRLTRVRRGETELPPMADLQLSIGDSLHVVGSPAGIAALAQEAGDTPKELEEPHLMPMFVGIALGIVLGSIPLAIPGLSTPLKIGLAGGPLLIALILSRVQRLGPLVFYLPRSANLALKELGIAIFLAAVGLKSGGRFVATLTQGDGVWWMLWGAVVTLVPLLIVGFVAFKLFGVRHAAMVGVLAGSMTDPPALAFANDVTQSEVPGIAYATVYPTAMILRVVCAQVFLLVGTG
jgi:putative transport protein